MKEIYALGNFNLPYVWEANGSVQVKITFIGFNQCYLLPWCIPYEDFQKSLLPGHPVDNIKRGKTKESL